MGRKGASSTKKSKDSEEVKHPKIQKDESFGDGLRNRFKQIPGPTAARQHWRKTMTMRLEDTDLWAPLAEKRAFLGLFVPVPQWPPKKYKIRHFLSRTTPRLLLLLVMVFGCLMTLRMILSWGYRQPYWFAVLASPVILSSAYSKLKELYMKRQNKSEHLDNLNYSEENYETYFSTSTPQGRENRQREASTLLEKHVDATKTKNFNKYIQEAKHLAIYGCGILAATHVGALRALENHGLKYSQLETLAGVSAGSVVVACLAIGYDAQELCTLIEEMPFPDIAVPDLSACLRTLGVVLYGTVQAFFGTTAAAVFKCFDQGRGPGFNTGAALESMVAQAIVKKLGPLGKYENGGRDITLRQVQEDFGKRVIIIVAELDTGSERRLTPEDDPDLPLRVAVRMSMGVPGLMEPYYYEDEKAQEVRRNQKDADYDPGHVYCDGGMTNDFPMNALPEGNRLGLMVRTSDWMMYHMQESGWIDKEDPGLQGTFKRISSHLRKGLYAVKSPVELITTMIQLMMDANLLLQIQLDKRISDNNFTSWAPEILTLCGGRLDPFDFNITKTQHRDLYYSGQMSVHMLANRYEKEQGCPGIGMPEKERLKAMLWMQSMNPTE